MPKDYTNVKITEYEDFVSVVEDLGFMPFSKNCVDFVSLEGDNGLTESEQWHTDLPSDPWPWRVKIEAEHKAAYAKLFDKKPGFISLEWYPLFLSARRKGRSFEDIYSDGLISNSAKIIYDLFKKYDVLATHQIKSLCGFSKDSNSKYEAAMNELQMGMFITTNGLIRKTNSFGEPYGWPATAYSTVEKWAGKDLIKEASNIKPQDAIDEIYFRVSEIVPNANSKALKRFLGF